MKRRVAILAVLLCLSLCLPVFAVGERIDRVSPNLSFGNDEVECSVVISGTTANDSITAVIRLYEDGDWVVTWNVPATGYLDFSYTVDAVRGSTYRLEVDATVDGLRIPTTYVEKTYR